MPTAIKIVPIDQVKLGMYVLLPQSWLQHSFLLNRFLVSSPSQLLQLQQSGLKELQVDFSKSQLLRKFVTERLGEAPVIKIDTATVDMDELAHISHADSDVLDPKEVGDIPAEWNQGNVVPEALLEAIESKRLTPEQKSQAVYTHSVAMMQHLLESPTAENLKASKQAIGSIADLILSDKATAHNMLRLTAHDFYTYTHSVNVGVTSIMLSKVLFSGSDAHDLHELGAGFFLHDLGKVKVDPAVINKPGRLTDAEMQHMRIHPYQGYNLMDQAGVMSDECRIIVMQHHERTDGTGYPRGLVDEEIHLYGKICCIADVFDALTAVRSYKQGMTPFDALKLMKEKMLQHFDKELFASFVKLFA